jgi:hydroxymethylpyrimidine pyrophosphatase-like HAD family hydrolase
LFLNQHDYLYVKSTGRAHNEIHYLVPESFAVDGIISSNGTLGMVKDSVLFKHSLSYNAVIDIVQRAQQEAIYYHHPVAWLVQIMHLPMLYLPVKQYDYCQMGIFHNRLPLVVI